MIGQIPGTKWKCWTGSFWKESMILSAHSHHHKKKARDCHTSRTKGRQQKTAGAYYNANCMNVYLQLLINIGKGKENTSKGKREKKRKGKENGEWEFLQIIIQWMPLYWATSVPGHFAPIKRLTRIGKFLVWRHKQQLLITTNDNTKHMKQKTIQRSLLKA